MSCAVLTHDWGFEYLDDMLIIFDNANSNHTTIPEYFSRIEPITGNWFDSRKFVNR